MVNIADPFTIPNVSYSVIVDAENNHYNVLNRKENALENEDGKIRPLFKKKSQHGNKNKASENGKRLISTRR